MNFKKYLPCVLIHCILWQSFSFRLIRGSASYTCPNSSPHILANSGVSNAEENAVRKRLRTVTKALNVQKSPLGIVEFLDIAGFEHGYKETDSSRHSQDDDNKEYHNV